jgi:hypothetical protein
LLGCPEEEVLDLLVHVGPLVGARGVEDGQREVTEDVVRVASGAPGRSCGGACAAADVHAGGEGQAEVPAPADVVVRVTQPQVCQRWSGRPRAVAGVEVRLVAERGFVRRAVARCGGDRSGRCGMHARLALFLNRVRHLALELVVLL